MKKFLSIVLLCSSFSFPAFSHQTHHHGDKYYVKSDDVEEINDVIVIKSLLNIGIAQPLFCDNEGYFLYESQLQNLTKGRFSYHYCKKCDQEFFTDSAYNGHVCRPNYYERHTRGLFTKNP